MPECSSCGADIVWAISPKGARIPLDAKAVSPDDLRARTYVTVYSLDEASPPRATAHLRIAQPGLARDLQVVHVSHFATCPNAASHSKR